MTESPAKFRALFLDEENSPNISYTWGIWDQNVIKVLKHRQIFCFAWKWMDEKKIYASALPDFPGYQPGLINYINQGNWGLMQKLHSVISQADIVIGHNLVEFDDKRARTDLIKNGFMAIPPHKTIDTLKVARSLFDFNSNKLDDLGEFLGVGRKVKHKGFQLWEDCMEGKPTAWRDMKIYNRGDISLLERVYYKLRPWMTNHPNMNPFKSCCPYCEGTNMHSRGARRNKIQFVSRFQCQDCGKWANGFLSKGVWYYR